MHDGSMMLEHQEENVNLEKQKCQNTCSCRYHLIIYRILLKFKFKKKYVKKIINSFFKTNELFAGQTFCTILNPTQTKPILSFLLLEVEINRKKPTRRSCSVRS